MRHFVQYLWYFKRFLLSEWLLLTSFNFKIIFQVSVFYLFYIYVFLNHIYDWYNFKYVKHAL